MFHRIHDYIGFSIPAEIREEEKKPNAVTKVSYGIKMKFAFLTGKKCDTYVE